MKLSEITLSNFRCFGPTPLTIELSDATCLVGTNGSGKSAVLVAITKLFGPSEAERAISKSDFHIPMESEDEEAEERSLAIEVRVEFPELKEKDESSLRAIPECFNQMIIEDVGSDPYCRIRLEAKWTATNVSEGDVEQAIYWITTDGQDIDDHKRRMNAQERSQIHAIYVPAARDPQKQLRSARGSAFARLLRSIKWSSGIRSVVKESAEDILDAFEGETAVQSVTKAIRQNWSELQNLATLEDPTLRPLNPEFESLVRNLEFVFNPSGERMEEQVDRMSEGLQSLFYLALVGMMFDLEEDLLEQAAVKASNSGDDDEEEEEEEEGISLERLNPPALVILGIEEPENHLAPHYLGRIMERLLRMASSHRGQVVLTSHSPSILSRIEPAAVRYLRLNEGSETSSHKLLLPVDDDEAFKYVNEAVRAHPELYFSTLVVLGEGDSENVVLPRVASALGLPLDQNFISFVPLGGRHVNHFWKLLSDLKIPHVTLLDLDIGRGGGGWGRIKYACKELLKIGAKRKELLEVEGKSGKRTALSDEELEKMHTWHVETKEDLEHLGAWTECLEGFGVFFSSPLDLDFSMLIGFPEAYREIVGEGRGPAIPKVGAKNYDEEIARVLGSVLKSGPSELVAYSSSDMEALFWYRYLFLNRGKPSTHFEALSGISEEELEEDAPAVFRRLVKRMKKQLGPDK